jgi:hypothetical protein
MTRMVVARCLVCGVYWFSRTRARQDRFGHAAYCPGRVKWLKGSAPARGVQAGTQMNG